MIHRARHAWFRLIHGSFVLVVARVLLFKLVDGHVRKLFRYESLSKTQVW
jgi:hypothetical protein